MLDAGQREYLIGPSINVVSGGNSNPRLAVGLNEERPITFFYGVYPSLTMASPGANFTLNASYAFGAEWTDTAPTAARSDSHSASLSLTRALGPRWNLSLSESFSVTADTTSFNVFRGVTPPPEDFRFLFDPVAVRQSARTNSAGVSIAHSLNARSAISFNAAHSLRTYGGDDRFRGSLSDQQSASAGFSYSRQTTARDAWSFGFTSSRYFFQDFDD